MRFPASRLRSPLKSNCFAAEVIGIRLKNMQVEEADTQVLEGYLKDRPGMRLAL